MVGARAFRIAIFGAGAVGTWIGSHLAAAGVDVTAIARGQRLETLRKHGWHSVAPGQSRRSPACAITAAQANGTYEVVIIAVKGTALSDSLQDILKLCSRETIIVPMLNGVPWWLTDGLPVSRNLTLLQHEIPREQIIGSVLYVAAHLDKEGTSCLTSPGRIVLGDLTGAVTDRVVRLIELFRAAEIAAQASLNIHGDVWDKLTANLLFNPLSALTRSTTDCIASSPLLRPLLSGLAEESHLIARALKLHTKATLDSVLAVTASLGSFKTSMLQDVESCRRLELDSIVDSPRQIAKHLGIHTPHIDQLYGMLALLSKGLQGEPCNS